MAMKFDIQIRNGTVTITVGGVHSTGARGAESEQECYGDPLVIGPVVIDGGLLADSPGSTLTGGGGGGRNSGPGPGGGGGGRNSGPGPGGGGGGRNSGPGPGGGGPMSGSGFSCPVVIGPIVIGGWSSGQASASTDPPEPPAQMLSVSPPAAIPLTPRAASFEMQPQIESDWCWAAVAVSMNNYLDPQPNTAGDMWDQSSLATAVLAQELQWNPPVDCSKDPNQICDVPAKLDTALSVTGNLRANGALSNSYLDFASIKSWLGLLLPIGARMLWPSGGAHFVAFSGYEEFDDGSQLVLVQDPLYGPGFHDFASLQGQYICGGTWQDTYLVKP
jgi:hypothetical protein